MTYERQLRNNLIHQPQSTSTECTNKENKSCQEKTVSRYSFVLLHFVLLYASKKLLHGSQTELEVVICSNASHKPT